MDEEKEPDFSNRAYLLPHINREGVKFGIIALFIVAALVAAIEIWLPQARFAESALSVLAHLKEGGSQNG